jgi:hypothetical protein
MPYTLEYLTPERLPIVWPAVLPMVQRCIDGAVDGEYTAANVYNCIARQQAFAFIEAFNGVPTFIVVFHVHKLPGGKVADVSVIVGQDLKGVSKRVWPVVVQWMKDNGIERATGAVSDAMYRICKRLFGFRKTHNLIEFPAGEAL